MRLEIVVRLSAVAATLMAASGGAACGGARVDQPRMLAASGPQVVISPAALAAVSTPPDSVATTSATPVLDEPAPPGPDTVPAPDFLPGPQGQRIVGCSSGGATAAGPSPPSSGKPPTMKGGALGCGFPSDPLAVGIDGACVSLAVRVGIDGKVTRVRLVEEPGFGFGEAARTCILQHGQFDPGIDAAGRPVEQEVRVKVRFAR